MSSATDSCAIVVDGVPDADTHAPDQTRYTSSSSSYAPETSGSSVLEKDEDEQDEEAEGLITRVRGTLPPIFLSGSLVVFGRESTCLSSAN